jgi:hypothetical protein
MVIFTLLPFFTLGEDTTMFKAVALDIVLLLVLVSTLFATSKSIFDEIEDRTMLTLMSKPVRKWEVLVGKYLGIVAAAFVAIAIFAVLLSACLWWRIPTDYQLNTNTLDDTVLKQIAGLRLMHVMGLIPALLLVWLQISALAAVGVALSVRFSLVVNLPAVILLYVAGNLTRFLYPMAPGTSVFTRAFAWVVTLVVPFLQVFDFRQHTIYREIACRGPSSSTSSGTRTRSGWARSGATSASPACTRRRSPPSPWRPACCCREPRVGRERGLIEGACLRRAGCAGRWRERPARPALRRRGPG